MWFMKIFKRLKFKKRYVVLLLIAIIIGSSILRGSNNKQTQSVMAKVTRGTIVSTISETGSVAILDKVDVSSTVDGTVSEIYIKNGDLVTSNSNLFKVLNGASESTQSAAYSLYANALNMKRQAEQAKLDLLAQLERDRSSVFEAQNNVNLKNSNNINPKTTLVYTELEKTVIDSALRSAQLSLQATQRKYDDSSASIDSAQSQVNSAWAAYDATQDVLIKSKSEGTVADLSIRPGSKVSATNGVSAKPALIIANLSSYAIKAQFNQVDISKFKVGHLANFTFDALKGKTASGKVSSIDDFGTTLNGVVTYGVSFSINELPEGIKPELSSIISMEIQRKENILILPNAAIKPSVDGKQVEIKDSTDKTGKKTKFITVKVGIKNATSTEIIDGIVEGADVIVSTPKK
jgi:multidrug resistance efflux pump